MAQFEDGDSARQMEELRDEVKRLRAHMCEMEERLQRQAHRSFRERVRYERNRSQRYNNYFAVISLECAASKDMADLVETVRAYVRNVDTVDFMSDEGSGSQTFARGQSGEAVVEERRSRAVMRPDPGEKAGEDRVCRIGIVLPHANAEGAKIVSARLAASLNHGLRKSAFAVYPSDTTSWTELLSRVGG